jgi:transposase-like protein
MVLEGIKGAPLGELCNRHGICQSQYYNWQSQFYKNCARAFAADKASKREEGFKGEIRRLKAVIGELTMELKKNDYEE